MGEGGIRLGFLRAIMCNTSKCVALTIAVYCLKLLEARTPRLRFVPLRTVGKNLFWVASPASGGFSGNLWHSLACTSPGPQPSTLHGVFFVCACLYIAPFYEDTSHTGGGGGH